MTLRHPSHRSSDSTQRSPEPAHRPLRVVPVLVGPTASGKTETAILIAATLGAEILSADSRQIYQRMDIGTAKPKVDELAKVPHHCINLFPPDREFNAGEFGKLGREIIGDIFCRGKLPLVVGGSGLYIQSLVDGFFDGPGSDQEIRRNLRARLEAEGAERLLDDLRAVDPVSAASMLPSNTRRIIRALEVHELTGQPISELKQSNINIPFRPVFAGLQWERKALYERINNRTDEMIRNGLVGEAKQLLDDGYNRDLNALRTVGYKEAFDYLNGDLSLTTMVALIKQNSRRYAKRQLTWFRKDTRIRWFDCHHGNELKDVATRITAYFRDAIGESSS